MASRSGERTMRKMHYKTLECVPPITSKYGADERARCFRRCAVSGQSPAQCGPGQLDEAPLVGEAIRQSRVWQEDARLEQRLSGSDPAVHCVAVALDLERRVPWPKTAAPRVRVSVTRWRDGTSGHAVRSEADVWEGSVERPDAGVLDGQRAMRFPSERTGIHRPRWQP